MVLETELLTKYYGEKVGCKNISIQVEKGQIFGFLGPNGAGKSTFVKLILGLIFPTSGFGSLLGKPIGDIETRKKIGYLPENFRYQDWMTGKDLLSFHYSLSKIKKPSFNMRLQEVLKIVGLTGQEKYTIRSYSKGMQQRIGIACSLISNPDILFFDEPTSALDPIGRIEVRKIIKDLQNQGKTIFLNSHLLGEVENLCTDIAIISKGQILKFGTINDFIGNQIILTLEVDKIDDSLIRILKEYSKNIDIDKNSIELNIDKNLDLSIIPDKIIHSGKKLYKYIPAFKNLESVFLDAIEGTDNNADNN